VTAMVMDELDARFTYSLEEVDLEKRSIFKGIDFRENYVRLKVGQKAYDEVLQNIEADILSEAILEAEDIE
jgi:hypothetical protein